MSQGHRKRVDQQKCFAPPGGLEPPTFRLTAERASRLRHGGLVKLHPKSLGFKKNIYMLL